MDFFEGIKSQVLNLYQDRLFPLYWLVGSVVISALSQDTLWVWIGVGGFGFLMLKGYFIG